MSLFTKRNRSLDVVRARIRRICDLTVAYEFPDVELRRRSRRCHRCIPVLLAPWQDGSPVADDACFAVTDSISDDGVALILTDPLEAREICLGFWLPSHEAMSEPCFFLGKGKYKAPIGGGFSIMGIEFAACASEDCPEKVAPLNAMAAQLRVWPAARSPR